jgi:hypothetical protein
VLIRNPSPNDNPDVGRLVLEHEHGLIVLVAVRKHSRQLVIEPAADWPSQMKTIVPLPFSFLSK